MSRSIPTLVLSLSLSLLTASCRTSGGSFLIFGGGGMPHEQLVERVRGAQPETAGAREDFGAAFNLYQRLTSPQAVELDSLSDEFTDSIEDCEDRFEDVSERIEAVREESDRLFKGWNEELTRFSNETLRKKSEAMMLDMQARTQRVIAALERVHARIQPVMQKLQDYALFFHHNLNARAIATLQDTYKEFDAESKALQSELDQAKTEVAAFLANFDAPEPAAKASK